MTLTEFLTARLDEDEALARDAYYDGQMWVPEEEAVVAADRDLDPVLFLDRKRDAQHAANWSPARVLAQVAAMRAIVDLHPEMLGFCQGCASERFPCRTLRHLATIWRDHDQYGPAWAPEGE